MTRFTWTYRRIASRLRQFVSSHDSSQRHRIEQLQRIIDKLQVIVLMKPTTLSLIENVLDGILDRLRRDEPSGDDAGNGTDS